MKPRHVVALAECQEAQRRVEIAWALYRAFRSPETRRAWERAEWEAVDRARRAVRVSRKLVLSERLRVQQAAELARA